MTAMHRIENASIWSPNSDDSQIGRIDSRMQGGTARRFSWMFEEPAAWFT